MRESSSESVADGIDIAQYGFNREHATMTPTTTAAVLIQMAEKTTESRFYSAMSSAF